MSLTKARNRMIEGAPANVLDFGATGDGVTDDRLAIATALLAMSAGDELYIPKGTYKLINATTTSSGTIVQQRADAVANSTLYRLTSALNDITITIEGDLEGTSALNDIMYFTGNNVTIRGIGSVANTSGEFLDTNSQDPLVQWSPSIIIITGDNCQVEGLNVIDPVTVGIYDQGNNNRINDCTFLGGPLTHGSGTAHFAVRQTFTNDLRYGATVTNCIFKRSAAGGAAYSGVYSVCKDAIISDNYFDDLLEHGVYANATGNIISNNVIRDQKTAVAIQSFNGGTITNNRFENCEAGMISVQRPNNTVVSDNVGIGISTAGMAFRSGTGDASTVVYENLVITNNVINYDGVGSGIDVAIDGGIDGVTITGNQVDCVSGSATYGPMRVQCATGLSTYGNKLIFSDNKVNGSEIYGLYLAGFDGGKIFDNVFSDVSRAGAAPYGVRMFNCVNIEFYRNTVYGGPLTTGIMYSNNTEGSTRISAHDNNGIGLAGTTGVICQVPAGELATGNGRDSYGTKGTFTPANVAGATISTGAAKSVRPPGLIVITPANAAALTVQNGANRVEVSAIADGSFSWVTNSAAAIGTTTATYFYEVVQ